MFHRIGTVLLALLLISAPLSAQRRGGFGGRMGGPRFHPGFGGRAPFPGFGNINHPGLGFAPITAGFGFRFHHPFPGHRVFFPPFRGFGFGGVAVIGVPFVVGVPFEAGGFPGVPPSPSIIIIQQPAAPAQAAVRREADRDVVLSYETGRPPVAEETTPPLTLLALKDHTIIAADNYWKEGDRVCWASHWGSQKCVGLALLDLEFTRRLNDERSVRFELQPRK